MSQFYRKATSLARAVFVEDLESLIELLVATLQRVSIKYPIKFYVTFDTGEIIVQLKNGETLPGSGAWEMVHKWGRKSSKEMRFSRNWEADMFSTSSPPRRPRES